MIRTFARALRLRCPSCGGGPLFTSWFALRECCPGCGLRLEREEGYFTGAMALNLIVAEGAFVLALVLTLVLTWPSPPWTLLQLGLVGLMVLMPLAFYPFSKTIWIALDLLIRPVTAEDLVERDRPAPEAAEASSER